MSNDDFTGSAGRTRLQHDWGDGHTEDEREEDREPLEMEPLEVLDRK